jgi:hypothetical protein
MTVKTTVKESVIGEPVRATEASALAEWLVGNQEVCRG